MGRKTLKSLFIVLFSMALTLAYIVSCSADTKVLTKDEAKEMLKPLAPQIDVLSVEKAPVEGLWEVVVAVGGNKTIVYLDSSRKYLVQGQIIDLATKKNLTKEKYDTVNKVDMSKIPLTNSIIVGDPKAKHKVFVFTDPECPYCVRFHQEIKKVHEQRKDIVFYLKLFPLPMHPHAKEKAQAIMCEKSNDKELKMLEDAYAKKEIPKATCDNKIVDENIALGKSLGVNGTPTVFLGNGIRKNGMSAEELMKIIDESK